MSKVLYTLLLTLFISKTLIAQSDYFQKIKPVSSEITDIYTPLDMQTDLYTGAASFTIPIYTIKDGDLVIPINLIYSSNGIKLHDQAGKVGLGWHLSTDQVLYRTINSLPDEYYDQSDRHEAIKREIEKRMTVGFKFSAPTNGFDYYYTDFYNEYIKGDIDLGPDIYNYNCGNISGTIVNYKSKIWNQSSDNISITSLTKPFKAEDGYSYHFTDFMNYDNIDSTSMFEYSSQNPLFNKYYPQLWHIKCIESPSNRKAIFYYEKIKQPKSFPNDHLSIYEIKESPYINSYYECRSVTGECKNGREVDIYDNDVKKRKRISHIVTPNYTVYYVCDANNYRQDLGHNDRIDEIIIAINSSNVFIPYEQVRQRNIIKHVKLIYGYFNHFGPSIGTYDRKRLRLDKIIEYKQGKEYTNSLYDFKYYSDELPSQGSKMMDKWGYFNNNYGLAFFPSSDPSINRATDPDLVRYGMLTQIKNNIGGTTTIDWEANTYSYIKGNKITITDDKEPYIEFNESLFGNISQRVLSNPAAYSKEYVSLNSTKKSTIEISATGYYPNAVDPSYSNNANNDFEYINPNIPHFDQAKYHQSLIGTMPIIVIIQRDGKGSENMIFSKDSYDNPLKSINVVAYKVIDWEMMQGKLWITPPLDVSKTYCIRLLRGAIKDGIRYNAFEEPYSGEVKIKYYRASIIPGSAKFDLTGGCRVRRISQYDGIQTLEKNYFYHNRLGESYGVLSEDPLRIEEAIEYATNAKFVTRREYALCGLNSGMHIGYRQVTEETNLFQYGHGARSAKVFYFTSNYESENQDINESSYLSENYNDPMVNFLSFTNIGRMTSKAYRRGVLYKVASSCPLEGGPADEFTFNDEKHYLYDFDESDISEYIPSGLYRSMYLSEYYNQRTPPVCNNIAIGQFRLIKYSKRKSKEIVVKREEKGISPAAGINIPDRYRFIADTITYKFYRNYGDFILKPISSERIINKSSKYKEEYAYSFGKIAHQKSYHSTSGSYIPISEIINNYDSRTGLLNSIIKLNYKSGKLLSRDTISSYKYLNSYVIEKKDNKFTYSLNWNGPLLSSQCIGYSSPVSNKTESICENYFYDPVHIDKIKEVKDHNEKFTYYEYDKLGRLICIRDENKNIIKHYKYKLHNEEQIIESYTE